MSEARKGDYGIDAPYVVLGFALGALAASGLAIYSGLHRGLNAAAPWAFTALWFVFSEVSYLYTTRIGKLQVWSELLDAQRLRGDERVLDVGCGRGAVLMLAAERVPRGSAVGLDRWSRADQSGNAEAVTRRNAVAEGVSERVELVTCDMRSMAFEKDSFDLVVSSLAIHNIPEAEGRAQAVREMLRVLKPGGELLIADFRRTDDYEATLRESGAEAVSRTHLGPRFWYGGPFAMTKLVRARKKR